MSLILFDIDGTLLLSGGAGVRAMTLAFEATFGVADGFAGIPLAGYTDTYLLSRALERARLEDTADAHTRFRDRYLMVLAEEIHRPGAGRRGVMPGIDALLAAIEADSQFHLALLTGNYEGAARIKLAHFGLDVFFGWGAFGEEAADRNDLGRIAMRRAEERLVPVDARRRAVVIGDTPHDIACAHAAGVCAVAVATGSYSIEELRSAGADVALTDLADTAAVLRLLECIPSRSRT